MTGGDAAQCALRPARRAVLAHAPRRRQVPLPDPRTSQTGVQDERGRFREIYLRRAGGARPTQLPDYRPCDEALTPRRCRARRHRQACRSRTVETAPGRGGGARHRIRMLRDVAAVARHRRGARAPIRLRPDRCSRSMRCRAPRHNARQIRDAIMAMPAEPGPPRLVLIGYSKGAPDILEAVVDLSGNPQPRGGGGERRGRGRRLGARQRRRAVPGRHAAPLSRRHLRVRRRRRRWRACGPRPARRGWRRIRFRATCPTTRSSPSRSRSGSRRS